MGMESWPQWAPRPRQSHSPTYRTQVVTDVPLDLLGNGVPVSITGAGEVQPSLQRPLHHRVHDRAFWPPGLLNRCVARRRDPPEREWRRTLLLLDQRLQPPGAYRLDQGRVVLLGLVGIGQGKRAERLVEVVALAQIAADGRGIAGLGMGAGQGPAAELGIALELDGG